MVGMDREQALEMAQKLAASYDVQLGAYLGGRAAAANHNASHWALIFEMIDGPPECNWLFNLNDRGENQIMVAMLPSNQTASKPSRPRRWLRFSLRTLLVVVTVVCVLLTWVVYQFNWINERQETLEKYQGYRVLYQNYNDILKNREAVRPNAPWSIAIFGGKGVYDLLVSPEVSDTELKRLRGLFPEAKVNRGGWQPTPAIH